jgi:hypothetical protein
MQARDHLAATGRERTNALVEGHNLRTPQEGAAGTGGEEKIRDREREGPNMF